MAARKRQVPPISEERDPFRTELTPVAFLLNQNAPEQHAKKADIPAQGLLLNRGGSVVSEFG